MPAKKRGAPKGHAPYPGCGCPEAWTKEKVDEIAEWMLDFMELPTTLYFKEFVIWLKQHKGILLNKMSFARFSEKSERFKEVFEYSQMIQEAKIVRGGLLKRLDSNLSKFMLCAVHGFTDKQTVEHQGGEIIQIVNYSEDKLKTWNQEKLDKEGK